MALHVVNIIPTYNEKDNITTLLTQLDNTASKRPQYLWTTLIVDDDSPDGTAQLVKKFKPKRMKINLLSGKKQGLGVAMRRGLKYAIQRLSANIVITNEADLAYDTSLIPLMLKNIEAGYDVILSSRHGPGGGIKGWTINRRLNHFIANTMFASWVAGVHQIKDHNGAFRAVRVKGILDLIDWDKFPAKGFGFFNYWCFILTTLTDKIYQLPIVYKFRTKGESKVSFNLKYFHTYLKDIIEYISLCLRIRKLKMKPAFSPKTLEEIWQSVPPDYYQRGVKKNLFQRFWHFGKLKAVLSATKNKPGNVLDVGCASGWFLFQIKKAFPHAKCIGADVYKNAIKYGRKIYPQLDLKVADVHKLPFTSKTFDLVICTEVLEHVVDPIQVLREIKRVSKPKAEIIIEMDTGNWLFHLAWSLWTSLKGKVWADAHIQEFNAKKLKKTIEATGLKIEQEKFFNLGMAVVYKCRPYITPTQTSNNCPYL